MCLVVSHRVPRCRVRVVPVLMSSRRRLPPLPIHPCCQTCGSVSNQRCIRAFQSRTRKKLEMYIMSRFFSLKCRIAFSLKHRLKCMTVGTSQKNLLSLKKNGYLDWSTSFQTTCPHLFKRHVTAPLMLARPSFGQKLGYWEQHLQIWSCLCACLVSTMQNVDYFFLSE